MWTCLVEGEIGWVWPHCLRFNQRRWPQVREGLAEPVLGSRLQQSRLGPREHLGTCCRGLLSDRWDAVFMQEQVFEQTEVHVTDNLYVSSNHRGWRGFTQRAVLRLLMAVMKGK